MFIVVLVSFVLGYISGTSYMDYKLENGLDNNYKICDTSEYVEETNILE